MYTIYNGGYNGRHQVPFTLHRPKGHYCYVILIVKSKALFKIDETEFISTPNCAVIIAPGIPYRYDSLEDEYKDDWLHFEAFSPDFRKKYSHLIHRPIPIRDVLSFTQYFRNIIWEWNYAPESFRQQNISLLFQVVLNKLEQELSEAKIKISSYTAYTTSLQELRLTMQSQPNRNYTPAELSGKLNISPSYFQFLYKDYFGIPFKKDLINMRLQYAQELLLNTTMPIEQIAFQSGYSNEIHFYRQFKAKTGMTPGEYQKTMRM